MPLLFMRFLPCLGGLLAIIGLLVTIRHSGVVAEQNKQAKVAIKEVGRYEKIEKEVAGLSDSELDKRISKRVR